MLVPWKERCDKPRQHIKKQRHHFADKGLYSQSYCFSSNSVWMWELDHIEGWVPKNWCLWMWCWRSLLRVPWTARRSNQSILKEINPEYLLRTDAVAETPILWPQDAKSQLTGKDLDAWKDWRQEEKGATEDEMVGWHHRLNGHKSEQTPEGGEVQGSLVCCSPRSYKELDTTEQLNKNPKTFSGIIRREACSFLF